MKNKSVYKINRMKYMRVCRYILVKYVMSQIDTAIDGVLKMYIVDKYFEINNIILKFNLIIIFRHYRLRILCYINFTYRIIYQRMDIFFFYL